MGRIDNKESADYFKKLFPSSQTKIEYDACSDGVKSRYKSYLYHLDPVIKQFLNTNLG